MVSELDLSAALTLRVVVPLPTADAEVLKQRLDALVVAVEAAEEKAATSRRPILAAHQLLDEKPRQGAGPRIHVFLDHGDCDRFFIVHRHHHRQPPHPGGYHDGGNPSGHLRSNCCSDGVLLQQNVVRSTVAAWQEQRQRPCPR
jgi:hypothetical protein